MNESEAHINTNSTVSQHWPVSHAFNGKSCVSAYCDAICRCALEVRAPLKLGSNGLSVTHLGLKRHDKIWVSGRSRSLKMAPIDRSYTTYWFVFVTIVPFSSYSTLNNRHLTILVTGHSRSLEIAPLDRSHHYLVSFARYLSKIAKNFITHLYFEF